MPNYHYRCSCGHEFEVYESIKKERQKVCPECSGTLEVVLYGGIGGFVDPGVTTLGKMAEKNSQKLGKYELSKRAELNPKDEGKVAYTNRDLRKKLGKMSPERQKKYIIEGK